MKNRIKEVIDSRNITQKQLAEGIGMTEVGISKAINGSATQATINKVANFLGLQPEELVIHDVMLRAAFSSDKTPLKFGKLEIPCYVLDNGMRVLSGRGIQRAIGYESKSGQWMKSFINLGGLSTLVYAGEDSIATRLMSPIRFLRNDAGGSQEGTNGYEATLLIDICSAIIDANRAGDFNDPLMVAQADIIIRAVAKVGIIALVDEATGYDKVKNKAKEALQKFLSEFLNEEASRWVKTFPDSFFEMVYKIYGWTWSNAKAKPGYVGKVIDDWVYQRLGPKVRDELRKLNPVNEKGNHAHRHHQFLAEIGKDSLQKHLEGLRVLAIAAGYDKIKFLDMLGKVYPKPNEQYTFDFDM